MVLWVFFKIKSSKISGVNHLLTPKFFARYAPGSMRKDDDQDWTLLTLLKLTD